MHNLFKIFFPREKDYFVVEYSIFVRIHQNTFLTWQFVLTFVHQKEAIRKWQKAHFPRIKVHRGRILPLYLPMHGVPAMSWTKLSRVSRAFTVSDVSLLCMLPRLVLNEVHHVTLLVYLVFALSREQTRGRLVVTR